VSYNALDDRALTAARTSVDRELSIEGQNKMPPKVSGQIRTPNMAAMTSRQNYEIVNSRLHIDKKTLQNSLVRQVNNL